MARRTRAEAEARRRGLDAGKGQASWVDFDEKSAKRFIGGWLDGDPMVLDQYTVSPLSGEYAGESPNELLGDLFDDSPDPDASDAIMDEYCTAFDEAYWRELERQAMIYVEPPKDHKRRRNPGQQYEGLERPASGDYPAYSHGYAMLYYTADGGTLCAACANGGNGSRSADRLDPEDRDDWQWLVVAAESSAEFDMPVAGIRCDHCNTYIVTPTGDAHARSKVRFNANPRKNVTDVARAMNDGKRKGKPGDSIWTDGEAVYSYNTALLVKIPPRQNEGYYGLAPGLVLNKTRYSVTTTQQQNGLRELFGQRIEYFVDDLDRGVPAFRVLEAAGIR